MATIWGPPCFVPSEIMARDAELRGEPAHPCHTEGGQEEQPSLESSPARSLAPVGDGSEKAAEVEGELPELPELHGLTKRAAEPGWL